MQSYYTLRNYGRTSNCSLTALFPVRVSLLTLSVGVTMTGSNFKVETGTMKKCLETGHKDYLEVSGGTDFAVPRVLTGGNLCGLDSYPGHISETILCGVSSVTLVSSGEYDNSATVAVRQATEEDILSPTALLCP
ncbi:corticotropin releasing hormone Hypothetical protein protein [Nesidiocoris tenuis]|uniref:Corticotropin-releasing factor binding protein C-terminal domain-containing protein n=1 Tax=Nesidiocoris tenuis TaxID=355587 RepID=A0ABN7AYH7_9HEMI|nr:corticotropin releasing hormone Hypothetical protein protein [Nesidiocoris tenuis]